MSRDDWPEGTAAGAFYEESWYKNRGGYRDWIEARPQASPDPKRQLLAWIERKKNELGDRPPIRALELHARQDIPLEQACRQEGTTAKTARKYLDGYLPWLKRERRRERERARRERIRRRGR